MESVGALVDVESPVVPVVEELAALLLHHRPTIIATPIPTPQPQRGMPPTFFFAADGDLDSGIPYHDSKPTFGSNGGMTAPGEGGGFREIGGNAPR